jgi:phospho-N-acetylmuramoyl-pentapeptide-transferase
MLYWLLYPLRDSTGFFNLFGYITVRTAGATITSLIIGFMAAPGIIRFLAGKQIGQEVRDDGPRSHLSKRGTPTMGGTIILASVLAPVLLWGRLDSTPLLVVLVCTIWMGVIGLLDDYLKTVKKSSRGLVGRYKLLGQFVLGLGVGFWLLVTPPQPQGEGRSPSILPGLRTVELLTEDITILSTETTVPFFKEIRVDFGILYLLLVTIVLAGTTNAVNLTDGLDGLATGVSLVSILTFGALAYFLGHANFAKYLQFSHLPGVGELTVFSGAMAGACLAFLWYNAPPAQIFMGDTGSLALGGAIGSMAVVTRNELLLFLVGGVFVAEALSVMIQVYHFKRTGKRVFRMAPIHHHFELLGWAESKVVVRFWIIAAILGLLGLSTFKIR